MSLPLKILVLLPLIWTYFIFTLKIYTLSLTFNPNILELYRNNQFICQMRETFSLMYKDTSFLTEIGFCWLNLPTDFS